ncbi:MAG TPA: hypothetical protein VF660_06440 [Actinomycetota bacterium]
MFLARIGVLIEQQELEVAVVDGLAGGAQGEGAKILDDDGAADSI